MTRVLVTGATGFVGRALCRQLAIDGMEVRATTRGVVLPLPLQYCPVGGIDESTDWQQALEGVDVVVHLAGRVHVMRDREQDPLTAFRRVNVHGTQRLAEAAAQAGVKRFVFLSSIKVNGEVTAGRGFCETDPPAPEDGYGVSKWEAEQYLNQMSAEGRLSTTILRSPLIYGAGVKGNLYRLLQLCDLGLPMPLGGIDNRRSLVGLDNLIDALKLAMTSERASGRTYLVSDGEDLSTSDLIAHICHALGRPTRFLNAPQGVYRLTGALSGQSEMIDRLLNSLVIDNSRIRQELGWRPIQTMADGIAEMAAWYRAERQGERPRRFQAPALPAPRDDKGDVSVVMVTYNTGEAIRASVESVLRQRRLRELIIVDNGNDPVIMRYLRSITADPRITLISGHGNIGFSKGCNLGAHFATGEYLLLLNPDCVLEPETFPIIIDAMDGHEERWMATVRVVNSDGSEQRGCRRNLASPTQWLVEAFRLYRLMPSLSDKRVNLRDLPCPRSITRVPAISGAFMFMRRELYLALDGLDPAYFLHFEDLDFCMRLTRDSGRIFFFPQKTCLHIKGTSDVSPLAIELYKARGMWLYFSRFFRARMPRPLLDVVWLVLAGGLVAKGVAALLMHRVQSQARVPVET
jgi:nucleoside-diphosphate-sugar epimerase/GT2 family glycosyltransferase